MLSAEKIRNPKDKIGFATKASQMDEFMKSLLSLQESDLDKSLKEAKILKSTAWKAVICPHDDYTYVGYLYPALLSSVKAKIIILIGVSHYGRKNGVSDKIIFDSFTHWQEPYGNVPVSKYRQDIINKLPPETYLISDEFQEEEHSVEAMIPFLQYYNKEIEIISILVTSMPFERMTEISESLAKAMKEISDINNLEWGKDFCLLISADAVHYGDEDWGGRNFAYFGADENGYRSAFTHEMEIINTSLLNEITTSKIKTFVDYTTSKENYKEQLWSWCGRYSVPFGLLIVYYLQKLFSLNINGHLIKYATSLDHSHIPVESILMGETAPANIHHWVGYAAIGYQD